MSKIEFYRCRKCDCNWLKHGTDPKERINQYGEFVTKRTCKIHKTECQNVRFGEWY